MNTSNKLKKIWSLFLIGALMLPLVGTNAFAAPTEEGTGEILIKFTQNSGKSQVAQLGDAEEVGEIPELGVKIMKVKNPKAIAALIAHNKHVEYAEPNYEGELDLAPSDPSYKTFGTTYSRNINAEAGWDVLTESNVKIGIVDTGCSGNSDLPSVRGYSVFNKNTDLTDKYGHGTKVAGTIGAFANNGAGNAGIVWKANLLPVKISESSTVTVANTASAIIYAADNGAKVINLSLGFGSNSTTLKSAVDYAYSKGCVLVAAAGNDGKGTMCYPAAYSNVLGVGGTGNGTARFSSSNYGTGLDVLASWSWYTTAATGGYGGAGGTSIASPQVSGLAALVWEIAPDLSNGQVMELIRQNTNRADGSWDSQTGYGTIDMGKTLKAAQALAGAGPEAPDTMAPVLTLSGSAVLALTEGDAYEEPGFSAIDDKDGDITHLVSVAGKLATAYAGSYTLTYTVYDQAGNGATAKRTITVAPLPEPPANEPLPPTITQVGSNPIILHLEGSPYVEQGAVAIDPVDGDISHQVKIAGSVDTSRPGTYPVKYTVTNSAGLSAEVTRQVRILAPQEVITRTPYNFSGQGKSGAGFSYEAVADADGILTLTVSGLAKATILVTVSDSTGEVFSESFAANGTKEFWVAQGDCRVDVTIVQGSGNAKFNLALLMPEVIEVEFAEDEVPLDDMPFAPPPDAATYLFAFVVATGFIAFSVVTIVIPKLKHRARK